MENNRISRNSPFNLRNTYLIFESTVLTFLVLCVRSDVIRFYLVGTNRCMTIKTLSILGHEMREPYSVITFFPRLSVRSSVCPSTFVRGYIMYFRYDTKIQILLYSFRILYIILYNKRTYT